MPIPAPLARLVRLVQEPPPEFAFEISEAGIAHARRNGATQVGFAPLPADTLAISPLKDNVVRPEVLAAEIQKLAPRAEKKKRRAARPAAVILPDFAARIAVLDFDSFPRQAQEQLALVRFRLKKSVPFDVEAAAIQYHVQPREGSKKLDVVAAVMSLEILARYETPFRVAGFHPGFVTVSSIPMLNLMPSEGVYLGAKLSGRTLTVSVLKNGRLKMVRCLELDAITSEEILGVIYPTVAFAEDELGARPKGITLCGFGAWAEELRGEWEKELGLTVDLLASRLGAPGPHNAGLLGYLEGAEV